MKKITPLEFEIKKAIGVPYKHLFKNIYLMRNATKEHNYFSLWSLFKLEK